MRPSGIMCRQQEALQLAKAESETLESRRAIALTAAKAWGLAAKAADARESRQTPLDMLDAEIAQEFRDEDAELAAEALGGEPVTDPLAEDPTGRVHNFPPPLPKPERHG